MHHTHEQLQSWLDVYRLDEKSQVLHVNSVEALRRAVEEYPDARPIGALHSYNRSALHPIAIRLGPAFDYATPYVVELDTPGRFLVGGSATIEKVMLTLRDRGYRLPASGNHRKQTYVGAGFGTHGFGNQATMRDAWVGEPNRIGSVIWSVDVQAVPLTAFVVKHCVCPLSELAKSQNTEAARSYALMPYSSKRDPLAIVSEYTPTGNWGDPVYVPGFEPWRRLSFLNSFHNVKTVKYLQSIQRRFRWTHRRAQRLVGLAKLKTWYEVTDPLDIDAMYHPWRTTDRSGDEGNVFYHSQRPSFQYHNVAFGVRPEDTQAAIRIAIDAAKGRLAGFIGVRELTDASTYGRALNFGGPRNAIDLYSYLDETSVLDTCQRELMKSGIDIRWHPAKHNEEIK